MLGFLEGQRVAADGVRPAARGRAEAAGYGFYSAGILEQLAETPYDEMIERRHRLGGDARGRDRADRGDNRALRGPAEISITVNAGGADHWQAIKAQELFAQR